MSGQRRRSSSDFKAKVAVEVVPGHKKMSEFVLNTLTRPAGYAYPWRTSSAQPVLSWRQ